MGAIPRKPPKSGERWRQGEGELLKVKDEGIILEKTDLEFENKGVFNPACIQVGDITHMFYRAINQNDISTIGYCQLKDNKVVNKITEI